MTTTAELPAPGPGRPVDGGRRLRRRALLALPLLALPGCALVSAPTPTPAPVRPPAIATVLARQTATVVAAQATPSPWANLRLVIANSDSAEVTVLDVATGRVVGRVPVGDAPWDVVIAPDGRQAYVSIKTGVAVVDLPGERVVRTIGTSFEAQGLALSHDGRVLFVGSRAGGTIARIEVATGFSIDVPAGEWVMGLATSPDGRWVLAPGHYSRSLTVIDTENSNAVRHLRVDPLGAGAFNLPHYAVVSPDGRYAYLPFQGRVLTRVTLGAWTIESFPLAIGAHQHGMAISADGSRLYVVNVDQHNSLSEIDAAALHEVRRIPLSGPHERVVLSPDGATAFVSGGYTLGGQDIISLVRLADGQVTTLASGGSRPAGMALVGGEPGGTGGTGGTGARGGTAERARPVSQWDLWGQ
jgi:YVTN family beta-propeller protein